MDSKTGVKIDAGREIALDLTGVPQYTYVRPDLGESIAPVIIDFGLMALYSLLAFAGAFVMFLRYDVRYAN